MINHIWRAHHLWSFLLLLVLFCFSGCGGYFSQNSSSKSKRARLAKQKKKKKKKTQKVRHTKEAKRKVKESNLTSSEAKWRPYKSINLKNPPRLKAGESINKYHQGAVFAKSYVYWIIFYNKKKYALLRWKPGSKRAERVLYSKDRIRGIAYDPMTNMLILRKYKRLEFYDNNSLKLKKERDFVKLSSMFRGMAVVDRRLLIISDERDTLEVYNLSSLRKEAELPTKQTKVQRIFPNGKDKVILWSSYWGAKLVPFNLVSKKAGKKISAKTSHRGFFLASSIGKGQIGIFDLAHNDLGVVKRVGQIYVRLDHGTERLGEGLAYRISPRTDQIKATLNMKATDSTEKKNMLLVIPPKKTYSQKLTSERFPAGGKVIVDKLGNRYLRLSIPALKRNQKYSQVYYTATLTRYRVFYDVQKIFAKKSKPSSRMSVYLKDQKIYGLKHSRVKRFYKSRFSKIKNLGKRVQEIYMFAVNDLKNVWDGQSDDAPTILKNMHGGCNEHSRIQIAFLRKSKMPARFTWNWLPVTEQPRFNHKFTEVWHKTVGWIPLEPLSGTRTTAGELSSYHFVYAVRDTRGNQFIRSDRLGAYEGKHRSSMWKKTKPTFKWRFVDQSSDAHSKNTLKDVKAGKKTSDGLE